MLLLKVYAVKLKVEEDKKGHAGHTVFQAPCRTVMSTLGLTLRGAPCPSE